MQPQSRDSVQSANMALSLLRAGGTYAQAQHLLAEVISELPSNTSDARGELLLKSWLGVCLGMGSDERGVEAKDILGEILPRLRMASEADQTDEELTVALASAEAVVGWIASCDNDDAVAHVHLRRSIEAYDRCSNADPEDALFALYFFITSSVDPDLQSIAMYEWAQPYLHALAPEHCRYGIQLLDLLADWCVTEGDIENAKRMYFELLQMANVDLSRINSKEWVTELVDGAIKKLLKVIMENK